VGMSMAPFVNAFTLQMPIFKTVSLLLTATHDNNHLARWLCVQKVLPTQAVFF